MTYEEYRIEFDGINASKECRQIGSHGSKWMDFMVERLSLDALERILLDSQNEDIGCWSESFITRTKARIAELILLD